MTDYELEYQRNESACGAPFPEFVKFFDSLEEVPSTVLDLVTLMPALLALVTTNREY